MATLRNLLRFLPGRCIGILQQRDLIGPRMFASETKFILEGTPAKPFVPYVDLDETNMARNRPMSPHLSIYASEMQSVMSFLHRTTGTALSVYTIGFAIGTLLMPMDFQCFIDCICELNMHPILIYACRAALCLPLVYHLYNGCRHLIWDLGFCLNMSQVYITGYVVIVLIILTSGYIVSLP